MHQPHLACTTMKAFAYALLLVLLSACRLSQPLPVATNSEALTAPAVAVAAPSAASLSSANSTSSRPVGLARQLLASPHQAKTRQRWGRKNRRLGHGARSTEVQRARHLVAKQAATTAAVEPSPSPARGLILVGVGAAVALASLLIVQNATTFGSALILGFAFASGIALMLIGLLFMLFSYLLTLYEKQRIARADQPKK